MRKLYRYTILSDGPEKQKSVKVTPQKWALEELQAAVGGNIETLPRTYFPHMKLARNSRIFVNEEGKFNKDFDDNFHFPVVHKVPGTTWIDPVKGPAVIEEVVGE